jgi:prepilin signal peptidase PulO-like enzyme (type II secretory pathway)
LEIAFGTMFLAAYYRYSCFGDLCPSQADIFSAARLAVFLVFLALVFVYDARHGEIPDVFSITGIVVALVINIFISPSVWFWYLAAAVAGAGFFGLQYVLSHGKWVGDGDILLGAMIGAMVGWPNVFTALFAAYILGLVLVAVLMVTRKKRLSDTIPLGPLLSLGTALVLFAPATLFAHFWYALAF